MKFNLLILLFLPLTVYGQGLGKIQPPLRPSLKAPFTEYRMLTISADAALSFIMTGEKYDSVHMEVSGFDADGVRFVLSYARDDFPADTTGDNLFTFNLADTAAYADTTTHLDVGGDSVFYWSLFTFNAGGSAYNQDTCYAENDDPPYLSGLSITGDTYIDSTLTANYTYNDDEGSVEDSTHWNWYNSDGDLLQYSGDEYILTIADTGYYIYAIGTPYAATGDSPGDSLAADAVGPVFSNDPEYFTGGIVWLAGTDTTQCDSIFVADDKLQFEMDGLLYQVDSDAGCSGCIEEMQTYYDAMTTPWLGDTITKMNDFFDSLDQNGYLPNVHLMYWFGGHKDDDGDALINAANPGTYDATNGTGAAAATLSYGGYTGDGGDSILTNYNPNTASLGQDAATAIVYLKIDQQEDNSYIYYSGDGTNHTYYVAANTGTAASYAMNTNLTEADGTADADGIWTNVREANNDIELYRDGSSVDNAADASNGVPDDNMTLLYADIAGGKYSTNQILFFMVLNQTINSTQASQLAGFINTFATYIGQNEY